MNRAIIFAILLRSMVSIAGAEEALCRAAAAKLPVGDPAPASLLSVLPDASGAKDDAYSPTALARLDVDPDLMRKIEDLTRSEENARMYWLAPGRLGAIEVVEGTAHCQTIQFIQVTNGRVHEPPKPLGLDIEGACWGDRVWLGTVEGKPAAIEENDVVGDRARSITASRWNGERWDGSCSLTETHSIALQIEKRFCGRTEDCAPLEAIAIEHAKSAQSEHERTIPEIGPSNRGRSQPGTHSVDDIPSRIPTFDVAATNGYTKFFDRKTFSAVYKGQQVFGVVGGGMFGWRDYDGWLVGFWSRANGRLKPLAGFQIERRPSLVRSVRVEDVKP